jgi:hypothetical protein
MAKRKEITNLPDVSKQNYEIIKAGVKVYPISHRNKWFIEIDNNGTIQRFEKAIAQNEVNLAVHKTILYCYDKINTKK